jgi:hypothetical protein
MGEDVTAIELLKDRNIINSNYKSLWKGGSKEWELIRYYGAGW